MQTDCIPKGYEYSEMRRLLPGFPQIQYKYWTRSCCFVWSNVELAFISAQIDIRVDWIFWLIGASTYFILLGSNAYMPTKRLTALVSGNTFKRCQEEKKREVEAVGRRSTSQAREKDVFLDLCIAECIHQRPFSIEQFAIHSSIIELWRRFTKLWREKFPNYLYDSLE